MMNDLTRQAWFRDPVCQRLMTVLAANGHPARFVGGCVRDALYGRPVHDIDIATPERPDTVMTLLQDQGIKVVATGIDHGTVTAVCEGRPFEITTLRSDVSTDGRRATVAFCEDWLEDAKRRDFTFNALSLDLEGNLYDPFDGVADLRAGRVRFIGKAEDRIREDYLRLLRFFRFSAFFGKGNPDSAALMACRDLSDGLSDLSGERLAQELLRLLAAPAPAKWISLMIKQGILQKIIPDVMHGVELEMLCAFEDVPAPLRRLACLLPGEEAVISAVAKRLRLSKVDHKRLWAARCTTPRLDPALGEHHLRCFLYHNGAQAARDQLFLYWAEKGFSGIGPREQAVLAEIDRWAQAPVEFPLQGRDLLDQGFQAGPELGDWLSAIESWWCDAGCRGDKKDCLNELQRRRQS